MKIAVINSGVSGALPGNASDFLPKLLEGLTGKGNELHLFTNDENALPEIERSGVIRETDLPEAVAALEEIAPVLAARVNDLKPDVYLIWASEALGWAALPNLNPQIATIAVGHADSETFYAPARHYRPFLTRVIGTTPEVCVGFVINCVIDKERVEWISYGELEGSSAETPDAEIQKVIETYESCFEKAIEDAHAAPREKLTDFPPLKPNRSVTQSWFGKLKAKLMN